MIEWYHFLVPILIFFGLCVFLALGVSGEAMKNIESYYRDR